MFGPPTYLESFVHYNLHTRGGGIYALHTEMAQGPIGPTPSSLLTQMSSNLVTLGRGHTFKSLDRSHIN